MACQVYSSFPPRNMLYSPTDQSMTCLPFSLVQEAYTRIFLHLARAGANGHKKAFVFFTDCRQRCCHPCHPLLEDFHSRFLVFLASQPLIIITIIGEQYGGALISYHFTSDPEQINNDVHVQRLECMVVIMYSKSCGSSLVDEARHHLFSNGTMSLENLPPTHPCTDSAH